ncbi:MFS transporter [Paenibacillus alkalitolerans]|uniref:MFS transporter n=1 Tax=Paenibacillus alkalitolerans TaxID=2799335 RepID=UPI0018F72FED|nr:MFS transporter [Paenibacillus alkalitolerans]
MKPHRSERNAKASAKASSARSGLRIVTVEGISAIVIIQLLAGPYLTGYLIHLGAGSGQIGFVLAIPPLANVLTIFAALYIQRIQSRKRFLVYTAGFHRIIWMLTGLIPFLLPKEWWVGTYIALFLLSFSLSSIGSVAWSSLVSDLVPARVRGRYFGIRNTILWAAGCLALIGGGLLLERFPGDTGFAIIYGVCSLLTVVNIYHLFLYPDLPFEKSAEASDRAMLMKPLQDRMFFRATLFLAGWIFLQNAVIPLFSYVMLDVMKLNYFPHVSVITTVQNISMMFAFYLWGNLNAKWPAQKLLLWTMPILALSCFGWLALIWIPAFVTLLAVHILLGIGMGGFNQLAFNFVIGDTPKADRPTYFAMFSAVTGVTGFLGPTLGGQIYKLLKVAPEWVQTYGYNASVGALLLVLAVFVAPRFLSVGWGQRTAKFGVRSKNLI